jgi:hypothetical protein
MERIGKDVLLTLGVYSLACLHALRWSALRGAEDVLLSPPDRNGMGERAT